MNRPLESLSFSFILFLLIYVLMFGGSEGNKIGCYVSQEEDKQDIGHVGFKIEKPVYECDLIKGVKMGDKIEPLVDLEHKDSIPLFFVQANVDANYTVKGSLGLKMKGPILYQHFFNSVDEIVCYKMAWNCILPGGQAMPHGARVSKYGVALKGQKKKLCPTKSDGAPVDTCDVFECNTYLCNGGRQILSADVSASALALIAFATIHILL